MASLRYFFSPSGIKEIFQVTGHFKNERKSAAAVYDNKALKRGQAYRPQALSNSERQIRLLKIINPLNESSGSKEIEIRCAIEQHDLGDEDSPDWPSYTAVSYTWGSGSAKYKILVNNEQFLVRSNLYQLLKALIERGDTDKMLWIDQLCIDQSDLGEKNKQVQLMGDIYGKAAEVYVWLGLEEKGSGIALELLQRFEKHFMETQDRVHNGSLTEAACRQSRDNVIQVISQEIGWSELNALLERPYWSRLWIFQEIYLAQKIVLICGSDSHELSISTTKASRIFHDLNESLTPKLSARANATKALRLFAQAEARYNPLKRKLEAMDLQDCLIEHASRSCYDPRDKVYGLIACVDPAHFVTVDYYRTPEEVFVVALDSLVVHFDFKDVVKLAELLDVLGDLRKNMGLKKWSKRKYSEIILDSCKRSARARQAFSLRALLRERDTLRATTARTPEEEARIEELNFLVRQALEPSG